MTCQVEGTVETIAIPVVPGPSPAQRKGQAASSHLSLDPVPGPSWLPGWLLALAFTPKGATRKQEMLPDAMPALGAVASPQAEGHNQAAVLTGLTSCGGEGCSWGFTVLCGCLGRVARPEADRLPETEFQQPVTLPSCA